MSSSPEGFVQEYVPGAQQELFVFCRRCRQVFPVAFAPRAELRLRCLCGSEAAVAALDVFRAEEGARKHAALYERFYQAAKQALRDAGVPLPQSGVMKRLDPEDGAPAAPPLEDQGARLRRELAPFEERVAAAGDDVLARHEALGALIEWTAARRDLALAHERFRSACREDLDLAQAVAAEAKLRLRRGEKVRVTFSSFKLLASDLEEDGDLAGALAVLERAAKLGLGGYADRAAALRDRLGG